MLSQAQRPVFWVPRPSSQVPETMGRGGVKTRLRLPSVPKTSVGLLEVPPEPGSSWWLQKCCRREGSRHRPHTCTSRRPYPMWPS